MAILEGEELRAWKGVHSLTAMVGARGSGTVWRNLTSKPV